MNALTVLRNPSRFACLLSAVAGGALISALVSAAGGNDFFTVYLTMLAWSAIPFALSRKFFNSRERSWAVVAAYVLFAAAASAMYPVGVIIPFLGWPLFYSLRRRTQGRTDGGSAETPATHTCRRARKLAAAIGLSLSTLMVVSIVSLTWGYSHGRQVKEEAEAFCGSIRVGEGTDGLIEEAAGALGGDYEWLEERNGARALYVFKYSAFASYGCSITALGGKVTRIDRMRHGM